MTGEPSALRLLRRAHALTADMLDLAAAGDWDSLPAIEDERRHLLERALADPLPVAELTQARNLLAGIATDNQRVLARVAVQRDELREELGRLGRGRRAMSAYGSGLGMP